VADPLSRAGRAAAEASRFVRFGFVGVAAFGVDAATLFVAIEAAGTSPYTGRAISFLAAATAAWALNRRFTFPEAEGHPVLEWGRYLASNSGGALLNLGTYTALVAGSDVFYRHPVAAAGLGALSGMIVNFLAARRFVFRAGPADK